jgi:hypothetical protein
MAAGSVIRTLITENFETIDAFTTTYPTPDLESLSRTGGAVDLTVGS